MSLPAGPYASYTAVLRTPEGKEIWKAAGLVARPVGSALVLELVLPARVLASGDYVVSVHGLTARAEPESIADFAFRAHTK